MFLSLLIYSCELLSEEDIYPALDIEQVVKKVNHYLKDEKNKDLQNNNCYVRKVEYKEIANSDRESYWSIFWSNYDKVSTWNCFAEMRVFNDGSIIRVVGY